MRCTYGHTYGMGDVLMSILNSMPLAIIIIIIIILTVCITVVTNCWDGHYRDRDFKGCGMLSTGKP